MLRPKTLLLVAALTLSTAVRAQTPYELFQIGVSSDVNGGEGSAEAAFGSFLKAAELGLAEAQFNVAVMYDSGRGVASDLPQAAIWYTRAALRGNNRAAYNLGQLYENGQGVPRNSVLAQAWFFASNLPAARDHLKSLAAAHQDGEALSRPVLLFPHDGQTLTATSASIDLIWTAPQQPRSTRYYVEFYSMLDGTLRELSSQFDDCSGLSIPFPSDNGPFAWRVYAVDKDGQAYAASEWGTFKTSKMD